MNYKLEIDSVNKSYEGKQILSDIYLNCEIGDIIGVFGKNGSGKSTLLKIIFGTLNADNKFIRLNNKVLSKSFKEENGISYLPQDNFIPNSFLVSKVISLLVIKSKLVDFWEDSIIRKIINNKIGNLSGGELKYLQIKLLLFNESKFCLLDEPYSGVSPIMAESINEQIILQSKKKGIIITDHNYLYLLEIATRIYLIDKGYGRFLKDKDELIKFGYLNSGMLSK
jgi:ABC-type lipopolysaccharide export system ATPase subunit